MNACFPSVKQGWLNRRNIALVFILCLSIAAAATFLLTLSSRWHCGAPPSHRSMLAMRRPSCLEAQSELIYQVRSLYIGAFSCLVARWQDVQLALACCRTCRPDKTERSRVLPMLTTKGVRRCTGRIPVQPRSTCAPMNSPISWHACHALADVQMRAVRSWDYFLPTNACPLKEKLGSEPGVGDNGKWICGIDTLLQKRPCIVYSFG